MDKTYISTHTDLILELQEEREGEGICGLQNRRGEAFEEKQKGENSGIRVQKRKRYDGRLQETVIAVENEEGERLLGKPKGVYITLEGVDLAENNGAFHEEMSDLLAEHLGQLLGQKKKILFAGLGNRNVTPDALGPLVVDNLLVTGHLGELPFFKQMRTSMAVAPGVMAQTGMETGEMLRGIVEMLKPDAMVAIDALAAKTAGRLNRTVQISDSGITPGSGVKNERKELSEKTMGIPVIAIGVPTVISIPAVAGDILAAVLPPDAALRAETTQYQLLAQRLPEELFGLFVTPKEVDESVKRISYTISEGINRVIARKRP